MEKDDYITGASALPETTTSTYKRWIAENNMVMSWLVNSMTTDIGENFLSFDTAKEIWDMAKETFSDKENTSEIIQLESSLHDLRQDNLTCVADGLLYKKIVEGKSVFTFLLGLNTNLDEIRGRIMGVKPLPSLREAFSEVRREESRKKLMMGSHQQLNMAESSALKTQFAPIDNRQKNKGGRPWCDHCRKPGHSRETCWKIHGKPADWKPRQPLEKEGRGNHVGTNERSPQPEASPFTKEQMEMLQKLLQSQSGSSSNHIIGSGTLAHKGNSLNAFTVGKKRKKPWIVDSGASDHMTGDATIFDTYSSCQNNLTVRIADGSLSKVAASNFNQDFTITWGDGRAKILNNSQLLTLSLDKTSGSGFQSNNEYLFGKIDMQLKLVPGNSAGTVTAYYLSSQGSTHDEIDFEFLGNLSGDPYILHTNVFSQGKGNREQQFYLWFDPTADFHTYSILWNPQRIIFSVDGTPIREFKNAESVGVPYPKNQPMRIYSSLWNADDWATRGGLVKTDWTQAPFTASYRNFNANACIWSSGSSSCSSSSSNSNAWLSEQLDSTNQGRMKWVQKNYMIYNYCTDSKRFPQGFPPECSMS
ncbi:unnamed protein product [Camellia sinensis]